MVEQAKREFIDNLKQLMHFFNNLKDASRIKDVSKSDAFKYGEEQNEDKIAYEFKFEENPFDLSIL